MEKEKKWKRKIDIEKIIMWAIVGLFILAVAVNVYNKHFRGYW